MALVAIFCAQVCLAADTNETLVVTPVNLQGWSFLAEGVSGMSDGALVLGPATPPAGSGSVMLSTAGSTGGHIFVAQRYGGTKLSEIVSLKYWSYGNLSPQAPALQFDVDSDLTDLVTSFQGRMVFEPYQSYGNAAVIPNTWIEWDALNGKWWGSGSGPSRPFSNACPQSNPCSTAQVLVLFPNIGVRVGGGTYFKVGSGWGDPFTGNVDKFTIGVNNAGDVNTTMWDFELHSVPSDAEQCKNGGYALFNPPTGAYKNQGECISSVVSNAGGVAN